MHAILINIFIIIFILFCIKHLVFLFFLFLQLLNILLNHFVFFIFFPWIKLFNSYITFLGPLSNTLCHETANKNYYNTDGDNDSLPWDFANYFIIKIHILLLFNGSVEHPYVIIQVWSLFKQGSLIIKKTEKLFYFWIHLYAWFVYLGLYSYKLKV